VTTYACRGPLVAWTPHLIDVAVSLQPPAAERAGTPRLRWALAGLALLLLLLLGGNLWALLALFSRLEAPAPAAQPERRVEATQPGPRPAQTSGSRESAEALALGLYQLLRGEGAVELTAAEGPLIARYDRLAARDTALRVADKKGRAAIGLVSVLAGRSADRVARLIEDEFKEKGYDRDLVRLISQRVRDRLLAEVRKGTDHE
jgi:hypothetical protein